MNKFNYENSISQPLPCGGKASWECGRVIAVSKPCLKENEKRTFVQNVYALLPNGWEKGSPEIITLQNDMVLIIGDAV